jgi:cobalt/nickel transport system permease protein
VIASFAQHAIGAVAEKARKALNLSQETCSRKNSVTAVISAMNYSKPEKIIILTLCVAAVAMGFPAVSSAMHIIEGYLPLSHCVVWSLVCLPFLAAGVVSIRRTIRQNKRVLILLAMSGAFIFVVSSLKIPSIAGSCSHITGTGLSAILFGPAVTCVLGVVVLLFQAVLLAHGGLTTLGASTFSMAVIGPFFTWALYRLCKKLRLNRKANVFLAAAAGDLITYCFTSLQLAAAYPETSGGVAASAVKFLAMFAPTQFPLSIIGGILTVLIVLGLESFAKPELTAIAFLEAR